jgi:protein-histidine pros-kinase
VENLIPKTLFGRLALLLFLAVLSSHILALTVLFNVSAPPLGAGNGHVLPRPPIFLSMGLWLDIGVRLGALMLVAWIAARWLSSPMLKLADAARELGIHIDRPPLPESGTEECRNTTRVFNQMQARIQRQLKEKTQLIAAVSHDLRTPLTRLSLRAESIVDVRQRERFAGDIAEMESMISATLEFLNESPDPEPLVWLDVHALLSSIVDDYQEGGCNVFLLESCTDFSGLPLLTQVSSLRRCVANLVNNAIRYGEAAYVSVTCGKQDIVIQVRDEGPGIPDEELENVLQPFYRLERSRNQNTGGIGLGLSIVNGIANRLNGTLNLKNGPLGGLVATLTFLRCNSRD